MRVLRGALSGALIGVLLDVLLIFVPIWVQGSGYVEIGDTLIVLGLPVLLISASVGAARARPSEDHRRRWR